MRRMAPPSVRQLHPTLHAWRGTVEGGIRPPPRSPATSPAQYLARRWARSWIGESFSLQADGYRGIRGGSAAWERPAPLDAAARSVLGQIISPPTGLAGALPNVASGEGVNVTRPRPGAAASLRTCVPITRVRDQALGQC